MVLYSINIQYPLILKEYLFVDGSPDFSIVSKAWWDAIDLIEKSANDKIYACDMALELRVMGGSDVTMAPQYGNKHGTLSIEPVSTRMVHKEVWEDFKEELAKVWMSYKDFDGTPLNCRVHWAKESPRSINVDGQKEDSISYWQNTYKEQMKEFFDVLHGLTDGVEISDLNRLFSNNYLDQIFRPQWERFDVVLPKQENLVGKGDNAPETIRNSQDTSSCCIIV